MPVSAIANVDLCSPLALFKQKRACNSHGEKGKDGSGCPLIPTLELPQAGASPGRGLSPRGWSLSSCRSEVWVGGSQSPLSPADREFSSCQPGLHFFPRLCCWLTWAKCFSVPPFTAAIILIVLTSLVPQCSWEAMLISWWLRQFSWSIFPRSPPHLRYLFSRRRQCNYLNIVLPCNTNLK